jgi:hypothetical protein
MPTIAADAFARTAAALNSAEPSGGAISVRTRPAVGVPSPLTMPCRRYQARSVAVVR